jgi:hypothetical protein
MSNPAYAVTSLDAVPVVPDDQGRGIEWLPIRRTLDVRAFGINVFGNPGAEALIVSEHHERVDAEQGTDGHEELYVVLRGHAVFTVAGDTVDAPAGTDVLRAAVGREAGTQILCVGAPVGRAYEVADWESGALADH